MKKALYFLISIFFIGLTFSCIDDFNEVNSNPHASEIDPAPIFSKSLLCIASSKDQVWHIDLGMCASAVQHLAGAWDASTGGQYRPVSVTVFNDLWDNYYTSGISNINIVVTRTRDDENNHNLHWAARIWRVYLFSRLTDIYGDIPYFNASKGYSDQNFTPEFDIQSEIYSDFFSELDSAVNMMDENKRPVEGDLLYNGDVEKWIKFANSLRLRLGLRLVRVNSSLAQQQVQEAISGGVLENNDDNCAIPYGPYTGSDGEFRGNATGQLFSENDRDQGMCGFRIASTLAEYLRSTDDPRFLIYGRMYDYSGSSYVDITDWFTDIPGFVQGIPQGNYWWHDAEFADGDYAEWGHWFDWSDGLNGRPDGYWHDYGSRYLMPSEYMAHPENPFFVITYGEVELLLAEAAVRGWGATDALTHFTDGMNASFELIPAALKGAPVISDQQIDEFFDALGTLPVSQADWLELINNQLWVIHFLDPIEAYNNWRRSGYPELTPWAGDQNGWDTPGANEIPRRFNYPNYIEFYNPQNFQEAINRIGGSDDWLARVWWDTE